MVKSRCEVSEGNFLSSLVVGRSRVAMSVSREVRRAILGPGLSPFGNLAMITLVTWICRVYSSLVWRCIVRICSICAGLVPIGGQGV
jgi:hypothetical protein